MQNMDHIYQLFLPCVKWLGLLSAIGMTAACDDNSKNRVDEQIKQPVVVEQKVNEQEKVLQLQFKLEPLDFELNCVAQNCPDITVQRLNSNYKELDETVDRYIYNYMAAFLQGFDLAEPISSEQATTQTEHTSLVQEIQSIKDQQQHVDQADQLLDQQSKLLLEKQVQPFVEKLLALSTEVKSLGSPAQLSVFIKPQVLNAKGPVSTIVINANNYVGGAHGSSAQQYINFELNTKKVLNLDNIIQTNMRKELNQLVYKKFEAWVKDSQPDTDFKEYESLWSFKLSNNFYLAPQGIVFQYGEYEIGPYAAGLPRLVIPYTELETILKPQYLPQAVVKQNSPNVQKP